MIALGSPLGNIDKGGTWGSYIGLIMLAGTYAAVGIFCSSLTDNLVVSFLFASLLCLIICYGFEQIGLLFTMSRAGKIIISLGVIGHYKSISRGVVDTRDLIYFVAVILVFLLFTETRLKLSRK